jgi:outer membrane lipoprotein SlyB
MMNQIKLILTAVSILVISACSSSGPVMMNSLDTQSKPVTYGEIVVIEDTDIAAPLIPGIIGTMMGSQLARNLGGNGVARITTGFAGTLLTNKIYDRHADKITVRTNDKEFQAIVPTGYFVVNERIRFTLNGDDIEFIERLVIADDI